MYKSKVKAAIPYFSVFGSIACPFLTLPFCFLPIDTSPQNLDLRMCSKLIQEIKC
jgi:hypothetical protein